MTADAVELLKELGMSDLEASVYTALLENAGATGYQIAKQLGKPAANTYKALDLLGKKGLIVSEIGPRVKRYSALSIDEYLNRLEKEFHSKRTRVENSLKSLKERPAGEGLYQIQNSESMYERAERMIFQAKEIIAADICPAPLERLRPALEKAGKTKIRILVKAYSPVSLIDCEVVQAVSVESPLNKWPVEWLHLIVDAKEHLTALIGGPGNERFQAVWSKNVFLSMTAYNGFFSEFLLTIILEGLQQGDSSSSVIETWKRYQPLTLQHFTSVKNYIRKLS